MTLPISIPLSSSVNGTAVGGSGFLLAIGSETFLVTVAHLATLENVSSTDWASWSDVMHVGLSSHSLQLFAGAALGMRNPNFRFLRASDKPSRVLDLIMIPVSAESEWTSNYDTIDLDRARLLTAGEMLIGTGYPVSEPVWPSLRTITGSVLGVDGMVLESDMPVVEGYSGGPVMTQDGYFAGMMFGSGSKGTNHARIIPPGILRLTAPLTDGFAPPDLSLPMFVPPEDGT